jgi:hypothetical protein
MVTRLRGKLRREISLGGVAHVVTITDTGLKLVEKGRRKGYEVAWKDLVSGDAALAAALHASLHAAPVARQMSGAPRSRAARDAVRRGSPGRRTGNGSPAGRAARSSRRPGARRKRG